MRPSRPQPGSHPTEDAGAAGHPPQRGGAVRTLLRALHQRVLGLPYVYTRVRPLVIGGLDMTPAYANLAVTEDDVVLDVGCGPGDALNYLTTFSSYHGFDSDGKAVAFAARRWRDRPGVFFEPRELGASDLAEIEPTKVMLAGLLHHLANDEAVALLRLLGTSATIERIATQDVAYLPGEHASNLLARLDRGRHVRTPEGYRALVAEAGLETLAERVVPSHPRGGLALYWLAVLRAPTAAPRSSVGRQG